MHNKNLGICTMKENLGSLLKELELIKLPRDIKTIKAIPLFALDGLNSRETISMLHNNIPEYDLMYEVYNEIDKEKNKLINHIVNFYYGEINKIKPIDIWETIINLILRVKRFLLIYQPDYYSSVGKNTAGKLYERIKINWYNDLGEKVIKITKSYGEAGINGLGYALPKLLENFFSDSLKDYQNHSNLFKNNLKIDLTAKLNEKDWGFSFTYTDKKGFIETAIRLELWNAYKQIYL